MSETNRDEGRRREGPAQMPDDELDAYILARLEALGVDLSVLPEDDPEAPADRRRIFRSARRFLRNTLPAIADFEMSPGEGPPVLYPAELRGRISGAEG